MYVLSTFLILFICYLFDSYKVGIFLCVIGWSVFISIIIQQILQDNAKLIAGFLGSLLTETYHSFQSGQGLITGLKLDIANISSQVCLLVTEDCTAEKVFIRYCVSIFIFIVAIMCLCRLTITKD